MASNGTPAERRFAERFLKSDNKQTPSLRKLNDSVYEFYSPAEGLSLSLEIIFFHGLERGDSSKAYVDTWTSLLESKLIRWPQTLLAEQFGRARILSVSYDSSIEKGPRQGNLDLYLTAENLVYDLIDDAKVAANQGLPVILVGKDFGGLVIKAVCIKAKDQNRFTFLSNLKGIFYYGTPHLGVENLPTAFNGALAERLTLGNIEIARLGSAFSNYRKKANWATRAILSLHASEKVPELVITEASQRYDVDEYYTPNDDIDTVCKSQTKTSSSFKFLTGLISHIERGKLMFESCADQGLTEEGVGFKTSLGFGHDGNYVPMEKTLAEVKNALQAARIVILHGHSGSGKSSLAKYLALQFAATAQQRGTGVLASSSAEPSDWLPNGIVYITCGDEAEITSLQRELLRKLDVEVSLFPDMSKASAHPAELRKMLRQELVEHISKLQSRVLVILDDVWDSPHLLDNLLVPGEWVRYLLTTQISTLWNAHDSKCVQMQDVPQEQARRILGNYANFEGGLISEDLKNVGDEIIADTGSHPLALATLGNILDKMERNVKDWQEVKRNLKEHLETEDYPPSCFGQKYPLSVAASMRVVLSLLDEDAMKLLYRITLFDGPYIPESVLKLFLACTVPRDKKMNISKSTRSLVAKGLVRIETETYEETVVNPTSSSVGDDMRVVWIHSLRQHFILTTKKNEIDQIIDFLDNDCDHKFLPAEERSNLDLAIALCGLYGAADVKKRALEKMGSNFIEGHSRLPSTLKWFVPLMLHEDDRNCVISQAAVEVFLKYVWKRELDDEKISYLLKLTTSSAPLATLRALVDIFSNEFYSIEGVQLMHEGHLHLVSAVLSLLDSGESAHGRIEGKTAFEASQIQVRAGRALAVICSKAAQEKSEAMVVNVPLVLTVLVDVIEAALQAETGEQSKQLAALASHSLLALSHGALQNVNLQICNTEGLLACLARSLSAHDNHPLQENAATALQNLAVGDVHIQFKICKEEGALSGLVKSLSAHDNPPLQKHAARVLQNLASGDVEIKSKICNEEGALSGLVRSLSEHDNPHLQENAAAALQNLALGDVHIRFKICKEEGALSGLVRSLSAHDNPPLQENAAGALQVLAVGDVQLKFKICYEEGALSSLVRSLSAHDNPPLQENAAGALQNLVVGDVQLKFKICNEEGALSGLVRSLSAHDNPPLQKHAAGVLRNLAGDDADIASKICNEEGALSGLVRSLSEHDNPPLQENAAATLHNLASGDVEIKSKICNEEGALSGLVRSLSEHGNPPLQERAAGTLQSLTSEVALARKVCDEPGSLASLVHSLSAHRNPALQITTAYTLASLALRGGDLKLKVCHEEGALSGLVKLLFQEENTDVHEAVACAIATLTVEDETVQRKVANEKGAIEGLLRAVSQHDKPILQAMAMWALNYLAMVARESIKRKISKVEGAASLLVKLSMDENWKLREPATGLVVTLGSEGSKRRWVQHFRRFFGW